MMETFRVPIGRVPDPNLRGQESRELRESKKSNGDYASQIEVHST